MFLHFIRQIRVETNIILINFQSFLHQHQIKQVGTSWANYPEIKQQNWIIQLNSRKNFTHLAEKSKLLRSAPKTRKGIGILWTHTGERNWWWRRRRFWWGCWWKEWDIPTMKNSILILILILILMKTVMTLMDQG